MWLYKSSQKQVINKSQGKANLAIFENARSALSIVAQLPCTIPAFNLWKKTQIV